VTLQIKCGVGANSAEAADKLLAQLAGANPKSIIGFSMAKQSELLMGSKFYEVTFCALIDG